MNIEAINDDDDDDKNNSNVDNDVNDYDVTNVVTNIANNNTNNRGSNHVNYGNVSIDKNSNATMPLSLPLLPPLSLSSPAAAAAAAIVEGEIPDKKEKYSSDCYSFLSIHGPFQEFWFFCFGMTPFVFQFTLSICMILSVVHQKFGSNQSRCG